MTRVRLTAFRVSLLSTLIVVLLYVWASQSTLLRNLEAKTLDLRFHLRGMKQPGAPVILVAIDDRSIAELGRWPWSRRRFGEIVQRLHAAGAKVIAFDLLFTEPETAVEQALLHRVRQALESFDRPLPVPEREAFEHIVRRMEESSGPDVAFASAMREAGNVVLPFAMTVGHTSRQPQPVQPAPPPIIAQAAYRILQNLGADQQPPVALRGRAIMAPIDPIAPSAAALGHVDVVFDTDGTPRYEYPVVEYQGEYYPALVVQVVRVYLGLRPEEVAVRFGNGIQLGPITIPSDESMRLLVNYLGPPGTFSTYAFVDVLQGDLPDATFRDAIVLIGGVANGLADTFVTPFTAALPGVERHATLIDSILRQDFLHRRDATALVDLAAIVIMGLLVGWLSPKYPSYWGSVAALGLGGMYTVANVLAFTQAGLWINLLFPLGAVAVNQSTITLFKYLTEARQKRLIRQAFQYYLHPTIVERVAQNPQLLRLGGESRELTVLFSDIRRFSAIAEVLSPEALVYLLNEYFKIMTRVVFHHNGLLDKYLGDGIMAVYGVPLHDPDHTLRACCSALEMIGELKALQARWASRGLPSLDIGIGINTANMVVGNMGSELRFDYTVMGDGVNLASRLEGANKEYGTHIIISESTWEQVRDRIATRELDIIRVQGKTQPTRIFEVLGISPLAPDRAAMMGAFDVVLRADRAQQWGDALQAFQQVLTAVPGDRPSQLYIERCKTFVAALPPSDWDGVYTMQTK
jgi:adenylate cyclase